MKYIIIIFTLFVLTTYFLILNTPSAHADGVSLSVSPPLIQIQALPGEEITTPITIENKADESVNLHIQYKLFQASNKENGQVVYPSNTDSPFFQNINLVDGKFAIEAFSLGPKQQKKLQLRVSIPAKEPVSDYYFSVVFLSDESSAPQAQDKNNYSTAYLGIATNVLLSIGPAGKAEGYTEEFTSPVYAESGPFPFNLRVTNTGKHFINPRGVILIKNFFGQIIGKIEIPPSNILIGNTRSLSNLPDITDPSSKSKIIWPEKFLLGFYSATLSLALSDQGPIYTRTIHFVAFPTKLLFAILITIVVIVLIYLRVKKKLRLI